MGASSTSWLREFAEDAAATDQFIKHPDHVELLALGLLGEAGSVLAEVKKRTREGPAYISLKSKIEEEIGDFLWYYVRLVSVLDPKLLDQLGLRRLSKQQPRDKGELNQILDFGVVVGALLGTVSQTGKQDLVRTREAFERVWIELNRVSKIAQVPLHEAARANARKRASRWPSAFGPLPLFDETYPKEEQLPRHLEVQFRELEGKHSRIVMLRINGINVGDRLTDNIEEPDEYRYHDIFHFAHTAFLAWSPVTRSLLRCKRKSRPAVDENEDGGRAQVIEEAICAIVFSRAKELRFFEGVEHLDYALLK